MVWVNLEAEPALDDLMSFFRLNRLIVGQMSESILKLWFQSVFQNSGELSDTFGILSCQVKGHFVECDLTHNISNVLVSQCVLASGWAPLREGLGCGSMF